MKGKIVKIDLFGEEELEKLNKKRLKDEEEKKNRLNELQNRFPALFLKFENVFREAKKFNIIDRYFHYEIEIKEMLKNLSPQEEKELQIDVFNVLRNYQYNLIYNIKYCYGLMQFQEYLESDKTLIIDNPSLVGISPFLFSQIEWILVLTAEVKKSSSKANNIYNFEKIIYNNLKETLDRLDMEDFGKLQHGWDKNNLSAWEMYNLIKSEIYVAVRSGKSKEYLIKKLIKKNTVEISARTVLAGNFTTGKLIEKLIEGFGVKNIKLNNDDINNIKNFVSKNFKNSKGKNLGSYEVKNNFFF
jgi:hypothetical protein